MKFQTADVFSVSKANMAKHICTYKSKEIWGLVLAQENLNTCHRGNFDVSVFPFWNINRELWFGQLIYIYMHVVYR